jgi:outer membrane lipoprotein-sorting protein
MIAPEDREIVDRLEQLRSIRPDSASCERAIKRARAVILEARPTKTSLEKGRLLFGWIAAAVILLAISFSLLYWFLNPSAASAFAKVQARVRETRSLTFQRSQEYQFRQPDRILVLAPNLMRTEFANGDVTIADSEQRKALLLDAKKKEAKLVQVWADEKPNVYGIIRNVRQDAIARLGDLQVVDKKIQVFHVWFLSGTKDGTAGAIVRVDPATVLPTHIEIMPSGKGQGSVVLSDLVFDRELDRSLFSLTPPPGYTLRTEGLEKSGK